MNGAESLVHTLLKSNVDTCFANPGTSEMHFVAALDKIEGMKCVLGLQENVVTGMADGYYRIKRKAASTLLHCGPGLANGMGNLHNARRARAGIVNIVGDHAIPHRAFDAPLTADTEGMARTVSQWVRTSQTAEDVGQDAAAAVQAANSHVGQIATLILPADVSWNEGGRVAEPLARLAPPSIDQFAIETAARLLREGKKTLILLADNATLLPAQKYAYRIQQATNAHLLASFTNAHMARGQGTLPLERVPYGIDAAINALKEYENIILVNCSLPVGFFAYPNKPSVLSPPNAKVHVLSRPDQDAEMALQLLAEALNAPKINIPSNGKKPEAGKGLPTQDAFSQMLGNLMPENAIISNESVSYGRDFYKYTHAANPHDWLNLAGGAIGDGIPVATGAAIAGNGRRVINLQADGSAMYSLQGLWTQAREKLPVTTILLNNQKYNILIGEYKNVGAVAGKTALSMLELNNPELNFVKLANGMGVEAARATSLEECADLMLQSFKQNAPFLIDLMI